MMKFAPVAILAALVLAGCQTRMTLEEAQALCTKQRGLLVVIYTQKITRTGEVGPPLASPGDCVSPSKFDVATPAPVPAPANPPAAAAAN
jgi:hypothetical protein